MSAWLQAARPLTARPAHEGGKTWTSANAGLDVVGESFVRGDVAQSPKLTADDRCLLLAVVGYGVWRAELPELPSTS